MNSLVIDCGNTSLKSQMLLDNNTATEVIFISVEDFTNSLIPLLSHYQGRGIRKIVVAAVCKKFYQEQLESALKQSFPGIPIHWLKAQAQFKALKNGYAAPETLGVDRWLGLIALYEKKIFPAWLISIGTAITVDYLDQAAEHKGGWILPGLSGFSVGLAATTALTPVLSPPTLSAETPWPLASNTEQAIAFGVYSCLLQFFENLNFTRSGTMIFTGGAGEWFAEKLESQYIPELVLTGLQAWQKYHQ